MTCDNSSGLQINRQLLTKIFSKIKISKTHSYKGVPCWEWQGSVDKNGYGSISHFGKSTGAYRFFYELFVEKIAPKLHCDHLCRFPTCVNPIHLEAVTQRVNTLRGVGASAKNAVKTHCAQGHPFDGENVAIYKRGQRVCKTCQANANKRRYKEIMELPDDHPRKVKCLAATQRDKTTLASLPEDHPRKIKYRAKQKRGNDKLYALPYDDPKRVASREYARAWRKKNGRRKKHNPV